MWLQRFTRILVPLAVLGLAGCGSSGDPRPAADAGSEVVAGMPAEVTPEALTMFEQATAVMAAGDLVDAELRLKEFLLRYPGFPAAHTNLAIIYSSYGNDDAALDAIEQALAVNPDYAPALNQKGLLLRRNGNFLEAEAAYLKAVTSDPEYALAHYNLGVLNELYLQRLDVALQHFELYQELVGDDEQVEKWIADLRRRVAATQRTANVAD